MEDGNGQRRKAPCKVRQAAKGEEWVAGGGSWL